MPTYSPARLAGVAVMAEVIPENTIRVLDHGFVRLDDAMASDLSVVNGARVWFARRKDEMDESDEGLIRFLMRDRHGTPFEHNAFRFHVRCPIFVAREWFRHRVGSFNEFGMRYAKATDEFYVPEAEDVRTQVGKPGAYSFEPVSPELAEQTREELQARLRGGLRDLRAARRAGRRARARALRDAGRRLHRVLLDGQRALADELRLAARRPRRRSARSGATPRPASGSSPSGCRSRTRPSSRTTASRPRAVVSTTGPGLLLARLLARDDPAVDVAQRCRARSADLVGSARPRRCRTRPRAVAAAAEEHLVVAALGQLRQAR